MWGRKKASAFVDESTIDRARLLEVQKGKLARAQRLKRRSSSVAGSLTQENNLNHYAQRLKLAYAVEEPREQHGTA